VVGPLLTSLPKVESSGGDDGPTAAAGTNIGVNVDHLPVLAVAPDGTQHIIQVLISFCRFRLSFIRLSIHASVHSRLESPG